MALRTLSIVDYIFLIILLLSSAVIGIIFGFFKRKQSSSKEYLLAGGSMGVFPTALSIMVSFLSAITLLGIPSEVYVYGTMYIYQGISYILSSTITALVFMPKFREMNCTSAYEYLEKRFDRKVRMCASFTYSFLMLIYMALVLYAPALALSQSESFIQYWIRKELMHLATGLNIWLSVVSIGVICTFYSSVGGMKAVIWTDVLQAVVILVGILAALIQGFIVAGGVKRTFSIAYNGGRIEFNSVSFDPRVRHTVWSLVIGGGLNALSVFGFNQTQVQRYMCVRTTRGARQALFINAVGNTLVVILCSIMGIIIYAYYVDCDPYTAKYISGIDQIFPYFVMEVLSNKKGLPGIFLACIFSGSLSTISSGVNSLAAVFIEDVYKGLMGRTLSDERQGFLSKILSIILGGVVILLTYIVSYFGSVLNAALSLFGVLSGPIMGVFFLGFFFPKANSRGGLVGFLTSLCLQLWILLGAQLTKKQVKSKRLPLSVANCSAPINITIPITNPIKLNPLLDFYSISYLWYSPIALGTVITVGMIVSYLTRPVKPKEIDPKLIISVSGVCCFCLPKRIRDWLRCGFTDDDYLEKKVQNNNNELIVPKGCNTIHTSEIQQTLGTNIIAIFPSGVVIRTTMNGAYDNPTMSTKD